MSSGSGASSSTGSTTTSTGSSSSTTSTTSSSGAGGASPAGCPPAAPKMGESCSHDGAACSYGDSPVAECRQRFSCKGGSWEATNSSCPSPSPACPPTPPQNHASCGIDAGSPFCPYADGQLCWCSQCPPQGGACFPMPLEWWCIAPTGPSGCPQVIPNEGEACKSAGLMCTYPSAACGYGVTCTAGAWVWQMSPCPA